MITTVTKLFVQSLKSLHIVMKIHYHGPGVKIQLSPLAESSCYPDSLL